jgi:hypothetical protein
MFFQVIGQDCPAILGLGLLDDALEKVYQHEDSPLGQAGQLTQRGE